MVLAESLYKEPESFNGAWNFGPDAKVDWTVEEVANYLRIGTGAKSKVVVEKSKDLRKKEHSLLKLDISKSVNLLGWRPLLDTQASLDFTCEEYLSAHNLEQFKSVVEKHLKLFIEH
jgi:CDP-glucose 4,6-dehydratase